MIYEYVIVYAFVWNLLKISVLKIFYTTFLD